MDVWEYQNKNRGVKIKMLKLKLIESVKQKLK